MDLLKNSVYRLRHVTMNIIMFAYGGEYRVKYTKTSNRKKDSKLLVLKYEPYLTKQNAEKAFREFDDVCKATWEAHWSKPK